MTVYDRAFNLNEWFIIIMLIIGGAIYFLLPRKFPPTFTILLLSFCIVFGMTLDHTASVPPFDLYDVNDNSRYNFMDLLTYLLYAPFGYVFVYVYDRLNIRGGLVTLYIIGGSIGSICFEWLSVKCGVFHYDKGYSMKYSIPAYLISQSLFLLFYHFLKRVYRNR